MDSDLENFLKYWFSGFSSGLEQLDPPARETILSACGLACGQSYTMQVFREARQASQDMAGFLDRLGEHFPASRYTRVDESSLLVELSDCGCDLVRCGWVTSPVLCRCSVSNLKHNFEYALGQPVQVELISSILGGSSACRFKVTFS